MATKKWTEHRFGELVRAEREHHRRNWTQRQLADKLADKGIELHWTTVAKIEKGERSVRIDEAAVFADVFGVSVDYLLGRRGRPGADRNFALRQLAEAVEDSVRSVRMSAELLGARVDDLAGMGESDAELVATGRKLQASLERSVSELAHYGATIAEKRSTRRRVLKEQGWADA